MDAYIGEIRAVGFNFAPKGWAQCQGQLLPINQSTALFSLLGTMYGGDGRSTFGLPDLRGRAVIHLGQGTGLSNYPQGQASGTETVGLTADTMPNHSHTASTAGKLAVNSGNGVLSSPTNNFLGASPGAISQYGEEADNTLMAANMISGTGGSAGGNTPHANLMPYGVTNYIICLQGIFPTRP